MARKKRKLTKAEKAEKARRKLLYRWIFINGKQVRVKREPTIDGMSVDEFILRNADQIWLHQNEMWEYITPERFPELAPDKDENDVCDQIKILNDLFKDE